MGRISSSRWPVILPLCGRKTTPSCGCTRAGGLHGVLRDFVHRPRMPRSAVPYAGTTILSLAHGKERRPARSRRATCPLEMRAKAPGRHEPTEGDLRRNSPEQPLLALGGVLARRARRACRHLLRPRHAQQAFSNRRTSSELDKLVHLGISRSQCGCSTCCSRPSRLHHMIYISRLAPHQQRPNKVQAGLEALFVTDSRNTSPAARWTIRWPPVVPLHIDALFLFINFSQPGWLHPPSDQQPAARSRVRFRSPPSRCHVYLDPIHPALLASLLFCPTLG